MSDELPTVQKQRETEEQEPVAFAISVAAGPDRGARFVVEPTAPGRMLIGTSPACELRLTDREVSRRHAAVETNGGQLLLEDLGSSNGTFVAGLQVLEVLLSGGETVRLGQSELRVERLREQGRPAAPASFAFGRLIGESVAMRRLYPLCERLAQSDVPVLIEGETGTGKELLAEALHEKSARSADPFVVFDCSAITPSLVESHLFGHEARRVHRRDGRAQRVFELANGGVVHRRDWRSRHFTPGAPATRDRTR
jgi:hypothetical protein